jgi:hypothetical protein
MSVIYVWDERWPGSFSFARKHAFPGEHRFGFTVTRGDAMARIVSQVRGLSQGRGQIKLVRICAHGNRGFVQLGKDNLTVGTAGQWSLLKPYFAGDESARIEIHACGVASATDIVKHDARNRAVRDRTGHLVCTPGVLNYWDPKGAGMALLRALHRATGVPVVAGINCQIADENYLFEGPVVHAA